MSTPALLTGAWTLARVAAVTRGRWMPGRPASVETPVFGLSIDTRTLRAGQAYLAIRGARFDGNDFLEAAARAGASVLIATDESKAREAAGLNLAPVLIVGDGIPALHAIAAEQRAALADARVIGVTGSNGKTSTVRLIDAALRVAMPGWMSPKSFNNEIGVALTLLGAGSSDRYVICEVGINAPGEMAPLASLLRPDIAVITSIGRAHSEGLGGPEGIAREKARLASTLAPEGVVILGPTATRAQEHLSPGCRVVTVGEAPSSAVRITSIEATPTGTRFTLDRASIFSIPLPGHHNAHNAAVAVAVAREVGLEDRLIAEGLAAARPAPMRMEASTIAGITIINDAYNASPESMAAALDTFRTLAPAAARRCIALGDMLELGDSAPAAHDEALARAAAQQIDFALLLGPQFAAAARRARPGFAFEAVAAPADADFPRLAAHFRAGDALLVKASRGMAAERLVAAIHAHNAAADAAARIG